MSSCSEDLLSTLVKSIREACEHNITFEDFTSVSGLICFDIDGIKQKSFVISELLKKKSVGEGNSSHLKTLNWKGFERSEDCGLPESEESRAKRSLVDDTKCSRALDGPADLQKSSSGLRESFAILHKKLDWCNRTFILKPKTSDEVEHEGKADPGEENDKTIIKSNNAALIAKRSPQIAATRCAHLYSDRSSIVREKKWPRASRGSKIKTNYRNCYPGLPKKPLKRCQSPYNFKASKLERPTTKLSNEHISEPLKENGQQYNIKNIKTMHNSPNDKPTALSWYETSVAPSSSFESIESIQPFYLVPHSEPLSCPLYCKNETECKHSDYDHVQNTSLISLYTNNAIRETEPNPPAATIILAQYSKDTRGDPYFQISSANQESPVKTISTHRTHSNGTHNTISSIEPDVLTVLESKPQEFLKMADQALKLTHLSEATHDEVHKPTLNQCPATSRKRASLMKWMGLFKKGTKTFSNETNEKQKQLVPTLTSGKTIPEPPMAIRLKQWN